MLFTLWRAVAQIFMAFFPIFKNVAKQKLEDYLTSPYFIVSVIMALASTVGIWFGHKGGKILYTVISIILLLINLFSILANVV